MKTFFNIFAGLLLALNGFITVLAQENREPPVMLKEYNIAISNQNEGLATLNFSATLLTSGQVEVGLIIPKDVSLVSGIVRGSEGTLTKSNELKKTWQLKLPTDGYYLIEVALSVNPSDKKDRPNFSRYHSFPLYVEMSKGAVVNYGYSQSAKFTQPIKEDQKESRDKKPRPTLIPFDTTSSMNNSKSSIKSQQAIGQATTSYNITVQISGQIRFTDMFSVAKGVPNVGVYLDWDYDNNPNTGYTPYYGGWTQHIDYDITDNNGYYYFSFVFSGSQPANQYSPRIRVYANNANSAAFDGDLGNGARFGVTYVMDISTATTYVYSSSANLNVDSWQGYALRNLYRARLFSINQLGFTPHTIRYYVKPGGGTFFCQSGNCGGQNMSVPRIVFGQYPDPETAYHEYGHFIECDKVGFIASDGYSDPHWFRKQTTHTMAWAEGWAEFYCSSTLMYWYSVELPTQIEYANGDFEAPYPEVYQFLDYSQTTLFPDRDNHAVEGAIACFFYSLLDGVSTRAPSYQGDNDDITLSGNQILNLLSARYNVLGQLIAPTHIEAYKTALVNVLNAQTATSVNALYNSIIVKSGTPRSATPTSLLINGSSSSRVLSWNDNTCLSSITYQEEGGYYYTFTPSQNNEQGFRVYRKASSGTWDGTLNGYSLVGSVGANTTSWTDNTSLAGQYSYVVVAYNGGGNSIPKAQTSVYYVPPFSVTISGPTSLGISQTGTYTASPANGVSPYNYQWYALEVGSGGAISPMTVLPNRPPVNTWYATGTNSPTLNFADSWDFELKCSVTDAANHNATSNILYVTVGGGAKVAAGNPNGDASIASVIPESNSLGQNYPNPFNPSTQIRFGLSEPLHVRLIIYDMLGREVAKLADEDMDAGYHSVSWNASNVSSGVYIYRLSAGDFVQVKRMLVIK